MSGRRKPGEGKDAQPYKVGRGKPPLETRFKKGQSGNPSGRKKAVESADFTISNTFGAPSLHSRSERERNLLFELNRLVPIREGDRTITLPAGRVVDRNLVAKAASGQPTALRELGKFQAGIATGQAKMQSDLLTGLFKFKQDGNAKLEAARSARGSPPDIVPHPDDIEIDWRTATFRINGPASREQKQALEVLVEQLPQLCARYRRIVAGAEGARLSNSGKAELESLSRLITLVVDYVKRCLVRARVRALMNARNSLHNVSRRVS